MSVSLYPHQKKAIEILRQHPRFGLFMEMGMGKTLTMLALIKEKQWRALVVCPLSIIVDAWQRDCELVGLRFVNLWEVLNKRESVPTDGDVYAINYDRINKEKSWLVKLGCDCLIFDESTYIKNPKAKRTKTAIFLADNYPNVYVLTGNPAPNSLLDLWAQMRCISPACLGNNFYAFRNRFFYPTGYQGYEWKITDKMAKYILDRVKHYAIFMRKDEWLDLPEKTFITRSVMPDKEMIERYERMRKYQIAELGDDLVISRTQAVKILRLREITSGFIQEGEQVEWFSEAKIKEVKHLLEEIQGQVLIWTNFRAEAMRLGEELGYEPILGGMSEKNKQRLIEQFKSGKDRVLIANIGTISHGITLTNCHDVIYYSLTYSLDQFLQSQDRVHRVGQRNPVTYYLLIVPKTIDIVVWKALNSKATLQEMCIKALQISPKNA